MGSRGTTKCLNTEECKELADLVEGLTHSGQKTLDVAKLKKIKDICKKSDENIKHIYDLIIHHLGKPHAEIRYSAFQLCDELFRRSTVFRELVVENLKHILELTAETNPVLPLPLPLSAAVELKRLSLSSVQSWSIKYGHAYKKLVLGFNFLKQCKRVDFNVIQFQSDAERIKHEEDERRLRAVNEQRVKNVESELNEYKMDITSNVNALSCCLDLLLPKLEDFFITFNSEENSQLNNEQEKDTVKISDIIEGDIKNNIKCNIDEVSTNEEIQCSEEEDCSENTTLREFGALNTKHSIKLNLKLDNVNHVKETAENKVVIDSARDHMKILTNSFLPKIKGWLQILTKVSGNQNTIKCIMDLKTSVENILEKYSRINIVSAREDDCVSTDSEMEDVEESDEKSNKINNTNCKPVGNQNEWSILKDKDPEDPTSISYISKVSKTTDLKQNSKSNTRNDFIDPGPSTSSKFIDKCISKSDKTNESDSNERKKKLLAIAPKLPFDVDLYHWEDENLKAPTLLPTSMDTNKFWSSSNDDLMEIAVPEGASCLRTRVIEYVGEFEPIDRSCSAPLPNGKLCSRKDRIKCPFHGLIVPRDEMGNCINPNDELKVKRDNKKHDQVPEWQDPELLKDIKEATGIDLKMPERGKRKKNEKKFPGLTDIKAKQNTAKNRLSKLVFNKSKMKKVAKTLDNLDQRRFRDKYGDQFHYMYDTA